MMNWECLLLLMVKAYFCSNKLEGVGGWDLYTFDLYDKVGASKEFYF